MKKISAIILIGLSLATSTTQAATRVLNNYQQVLTALKYGYHVRGVVTLDNCTLTDARTTDGHEEFKGDFIGMEFSTFSNTHFTVKGKPIHGVVTSSTEVAKHERYNYRTQVMKVFEDNTAEYTWAIGEVKSGDVLKSWTWTCQLGTVKNKDNTAAIFYAID